MIPKNHDGPSDWEIAGDDSPTLSRNLVTHDLAREREEPDNEPDAGDTEDALHRFWFRPWWPVNVDTDKDQQNFFVQTRMAHREGEALLVDPGAHGDLCSDEWVRAMEKEARARGRQPPRIRKLDHPVTVGGVGRGAEEAVEEVVVEIGVDGKTEEYTAPMLRNSCTPALLGIRSLRDRRALIDCFSQKMYTVGPGGYKIALSPGSKTHDLELSTGRHLMLPC